MTGHDEHGEHHAPRGYVAPGYIQFVKRVADLAVNKPAAAIDKFWTSIQRKDPTNVWYHRRYRRVPGIESCLTDDAACIFEASEQYKRDKLVEHQILKILKLKVDECHFYYPIVDRQSYGYCDEVDREYDEASTNFFIKYGDLGAFTSPVQALMKQKHRMIWERRHGPVGTGMAHEEPRTIAALEVQKDDPLMRTFGALQEKYMNCSGNHGFRIRDEPPRPVPTLLPEQSK